MSGRYNPTQNSTRRRSSIPMADVRQVQGNHERWLGRQKTKKEVPTRARQTANNHIAPATPTDDDDDQPPSDDSNEKNSQHTFEQDDTVTDASKKSVNKCTSTQTSTAAQNTEDQPETATVAAAAVAARRQSVSNEASAAHTTCRETVVNAPQPTSPILRRSPRLSRKRSSEEAELKTTEVKDERPGSAEKRAKK